MTNFPDHPRLKLSEAGLRGIVGEMLTPPLICQTVGAFSELLEDGPVAVGRDTRFSSPVILELVTAAFQSVGRDVIDLGICPVPTIEYYVRTEGIAGAIDVTASHNPAQWNALKFIGKGGYFLEKEEAARVREIFERNEIEWSTYDRLGSRRSDATAIDRHIDRLLEIVDVEAIRARRFKVAIDCVNGSASLATPQLLEALNCEIHAIYCEPDTGFPHPPEPRPQNLGNLIQLTKESGADIGFAQDPDADRLAMVAEGGRPLSEEYTLVLCADHVLSSKPGQAVVGNLSGSRMLEDVANKYGSPCHRTRIGEINVSKKLRDCKGAIGGEGNGGVMVPELHEGRDSFTGIALLLELMAKRDEPIGALADSLPKYSMLKFQKEVDPSEVDAIIEKIEKTFENPVDVDRRDGVKLIWDDRWLHVRPSNTEPIIRIMLEAPTEDDAQKMMQLATAD